MWCWKDLAQGIAKWHLSSVEALLSAKIWKSENGPISWTEWNILINFYINIDIDKILSKWLRTDLFYRSRLCRAPNAKKLKMALSLELSRILWWNVWYWQDVANEIVKWHLGLVEVLPRFKFWKSENDPISLPFWYILIKFCIAITIDMI